MIKCEDNISKNMVNYILGREKPLTLQKLVAIMTQLELDCSYCTSIKDYINTNELDFAGNLNGEGNYHYVIEWHWLKDGYENIVKNLVEYRKLFDVYCNAPIIAMYKLEYVE